MSAEIDARFGMSELPPRFEGAVLAATVYDEGAAGVLSRWINWTGWLAAAACLMLAVVIAVMDRRPGATPTGPVAKAPPPIVPTTVQPVGYSVGSELRSRVLDAYPAARGAKSPAGDGTAAVPMSMDDDSGWRTGPTVAELMAASLITPEDSETLYTASILLDMIANTDTEAAEEAFVSAERVRQTAEYDNLLSRLTATRGRLAPADRASVFAAESILLRVVRGPVNLSDLQLLRDTVVGMNLAERLDAISHRPTSSPSV